MKQLAFVVVLVVCARGQGSLGAWIGSAPSAPRLFNDGLWRGMSAGAELGVYSMPMSPLFDLPMAFAVGAEYVQPSASSVALLDDYRGWIVRCSFVWYAGTATAPYLRLGTGATLGERYRHEVERDSTSPLRWHPARAVAVFWGLGVRGILDGAIGWFAEIECTTGDQIGLLLPLRVGVNYRWSTR